MIKLTKLLAFSFAFLVSAITLNAQTNNEEEIYQVVEQQAEYPDGQAALFKWLDANIKYPEEAKSNRIQGKVIIRFVVEKNGERSNVVVLRGTNSSLDNEAKRLVKAMPQWKPGKHGSNPVRSYFTLPIVFRL